MKKNLFIVSSFGHGGAEREMYELDKVMKKHSLPLDILSVFDLDKSTGSASYYHDKHKKLGTEIHFFFQLINGGRTLWEKIKRKLGFIHEMPEKQRTINKLLKQYDNVFFMGEYTYRYLENTIPSQLLDRTNIFVMSSRFQGEVFRDIGKSTNYLFITGFHELSEIEYEFDTFEKYENICFLLSLEIPAKGNKWTPHSRSKKKIGIFTRLSSSKPIDPFLYSFQILLSRNPELELHIFGGGDPEESGYNRYIRHLGLENKVVFRGHQDDIRSTLIIDELDLIWFQGSLNKPAGYAALDVALAGTPQLFWDFFPGPNPDIDSLDVVFPHFKNVLLFVDASYRVLSDNAFASQLSQKQFDEVFATRNMAINFKRIEHLFV